MEMETVDIVIEKLVYGGYGLARYNNKIYLVEGAYPGEFVKVREKSHKKNTIFAEIVQIIEPSEFRYKSPCEHFPKCGGCQWINLKYEKQVEYKFEIVKEQLARIGKIECQINPMISSDSNFEYRTKMEYAFSYSNGKAHLGLKERNTNNILDIKKCMIAPYPFDHIRNSVRDVVNEVGVPIYDPRTKRGSLKHLVLRKTFSKNETMVIFVTNSENIPKGKEFREALKDRFSADSIVHVMNTNDRIVLRGPHKVWKGEGVIKEEIDGFEYLIPPTSFFQTNFDVTRKIMNYILDYFKKNVSPNDKLLDLYCGVGLFGVYYAPLFEETVCVEESRTAVKAARSNANINSIKNIRFHDHDAHEYLKNIISEGKTFDYVIIDPPREGIDKESCNTIAKIAKKGIVYVSCDPATLSRDLSYFTEYGFKINSVQPFDMFPNTYHVENVTILEKL